MHAASFAHVRHWVFDLDNTLYSPEVRLFEQIQLKMTQWVMEALRLDRAAADALRADYWRRYGTTLAGLMEEHGIDPDPYLEVVHEIALDALTPDPDLAAAIGALPGRRIVFTNGSAPYARRVLAARGLEGLFHAVYGVEHARYRPKPEIVAYQTVFGTDGCEPATAAMFEDDVRNLREPHALGMRTVLVAPEAVEAPHVHHHTVDLTAFLARLGG
ncbi:pyrimidine 5'-nucleotidase [Roseitranquillus sediminis]|uniref:pyrimidine 5'-nucleotidase n=1 Tax=Roseitranquillus sediminis TaxID=2809051 RepID=UPI001D0C396C|nr:pyrimidine 5'-nucleotidase [Roseitranquillus sediminis]MBM9594736.1 pyrimidine 5'-nucleotidase [Roseitranquillus sediminis]